MESKKNKGSGELVSSMGKSSSSARDVKRNYRIFRRKMQTQELKTDGIERLNQEARDEKFKFPPLFEVDTKVISKFYEQSPTGSKTDLKIAQRLPDICQESDEPEELTLPTKLCYVTRTLDKQENKKIEQQHYVNKIERLRKLLERQKFQQAEAENEKIPLNFESFDHDYVAEYNAWIAPIPRLDKEIPDYRAFPYPSNEQNFQALTQQLKEKSLNEIKQEFIESAAAFEECDADDEESPEKQNKKKRPRIRDDPLFKSKRMGEKFKPKLVKSELLPIRNRHESTKPESAIKQHIDNLNTKVDYQLSLKRQKSPDIQRLLTEKPSRKISSKIEHPRKDYSLPWIGDEIEEARRKLLQEKEEAKMKRQELVAKDDIKVKIMRTSCDDNEENEIRAEYIKIITEKLKIKDSDDETEKELEIPVTRNESDISSSCTNFTNDSGSHMVLLGKKVRMTELAVGQQKSEPQTIPKKPARDPKTNPFYYGPEMDPDVLLPKMKKSQDKFHTYTSRSAAGIRERLQIWNDDFKELQVGGFKTSYATEWDPYYLSDISQERSGTEYHVKRSEERESLRNALLHKFMTFYIRENLEETFQAEKNEQRAMDDVDACVKSYEDYLEEYQEINFGKSIQLLRTLNEEYANTNEIRKQYEAVRSKMEPLGMRIFRLSTNFIEKSILQNFQILLMPMEWRREHDFLHRNELGELETFTESLEKRNTANLWDRNKDDVWITKDFYENTFLTRKQQQIIVFPDADSFMKTYKDLRLRSGKFVVHYNLNYHEYINLQLEHEETQERLEKFLSKSRIVVDILSKKRRTMAGLVDKVKGIVYDLVEDPLKDSISAKLLRELEVNCDVMFRYVILNQPDGGPDAIDLTAIEKFKAIEHKVLQLMEEFDRLPEELRKHQEKMTRTRVLKQLKRAKKAVEVEQNLKLTLEQFKRCLAKPPKKEKREGKLPRSVIPKKPPKPARKQKILSDLEFDYIKAFTFFDQADVEMDPKFLENIRIEMMEYFRKILYDYETRKEQELSESSQALIPQMKEFLNKWDHLKQIN